MTDIPEDIKEDCVSLIDALNEQAVVFFSTNDGDQLEPVLALPIIARALLAAEKRGAEREKERAAKIAEELPMGMFNHPETIATAIRKGEE